MLRLRPYHPTYVIAYFGSGGKQDGFNRDGFNAVLERIRRDPDIEVRLVEGYDDICRGCDRLVPSDAGSRWGAGHTCPSAANVDTVRQVTAANRRVLRALGLEFESVLKFRELAARLAATIPVLDDETLGGPRFQARYEAGLAALAGCRE